MVSDEDCEVQRSITTADWVVAWCKDGRLVQWPWGGESSGRLEHTADGKVWTPVDVSSDGRRVLVRQYTDNLSEHYAKPVVLEEGRAIWEDPSRSSLLSLSPSGRWLLASSPSGFEIHDIDKDQKTALMVAFPAPSCGSRIPQDSRSFEPVERWSATGSMATTYERMRPVVSRSRVASRGSQESRT